MGHLGGSVVECLQLRAWSRGPGIKSHIGFPPGILLLPLPMSLPLSVCLSHLNRQNLKKKKKKSTQPECKNRPKTLTDISPRKVYRWQISVWKDVPHYMSSEKCKWKQSWETTTHLLEWPKSRTLTAPNAGEDGKQEELSNTAGGNVKYYSHFGRWFVVSYKTNILLSYNLAIMSLAICPKELKTYVHTKTCTSLFIVVLLIIAQTWKTTNMSLCRWIG